MIKNNTIAVMLLLLLFVYCTDIELIRIRTITFLGQKKNECKRKSQNKVLKTKCYTLCVYEQWSVPV